MHHYANGCFNWLIPEHHGVNPFREAISILSKKYKKITLIHPVALGFISGLRAIKMMKKHIQQQSQRLIFFQYTAHSSCIEWEGEGRGNSCITLICNSINTKSAIMAVCENSSKKSEKGCRFYFNLRWIASKSFHSSLQITCALQFFNG